MAKQSRRQERSHAFQVLYSLNFTPAESFNTLINAYNDSPDNAGKPVPEDEPEGFAWELVKGVWTNVKELDRIIDRHSKHWKVDRIGKIEITLLRLSIYEMLYRSDVPAKVAINEAIELSKNFGDEKSRSFVNGILDAAAKALEKGELKPEYR